MPGKLYGECLPWKRRLCTGCGRQGKYCWVDIHKVLFEKSSSTKTLSFITDCLKFLRGYQKKIEDISDKLVPGQIILHYSGIPESENSNHEIKKSVFTVFELKIIISVILKHWRNTILYVYVKKGVLIDRLTSYPTGSSDPATPLKATTHWTILSPSLTPMSMGISQ